MSKKQSGHPAQDLCDTVERISAEAEASSARDARIVRTDHALQQALLALLERKPLEQIKIREIAAEAGVHYATFFRHHPTREALLDRVAAEQIGRLVALALPVQDSVDTESAFVELFAYVSRHRSLWTTLLTGGAAGAMRAELLRVARELAVDRAPKDGLLPVELATTCTVSVIVETISWWLRQPPQAYPVKRAARILHRLLESSMLEPGA